MVIKNDPASLTDYCISIGRPVPEYEEIISQSNYYTSKYIINFYDERSLFTDFIKEKFFDEEVIVPVINFLNGYVDCINYPLTNTQIEKLINTIKESNLFYGVVDWISNISTHQAFDE